MDKRKAKRWACTRVSIWIENMLDFEDRRLSEEDKNRVTEAMKELCDEMARRGLYEGE